MADYINMQQTEYDELQTNLILLHELIISGENDIRAAISELVSYEGGLYVQGISSRSESLLSQMEVMITQNISNSFSESEKAVADYVSSVIQLDVVST